MVIRMTVDVTTRSALLRRIWADTVGRLQRLIGTGLVLAAACLIQMPAAAAQQSADLTDFVASRGVDPVGSALLIVRLEDGAEWSSGGNRIDQRFEPASTSKIPHTLIALQTGAVEGPDARFAWDGVDRGIRSWNRNQTVATAYTNSVVWVYQRIVEGIGGVTMADWLGRLDYGNADIGGPDDLTTYWLRGPLAISVREQTAFLGRLVNRDLPLSNPTYDVALDIMRADAGDGWTLYAKSGWRRDDVRTDLGWYVGWLETTARDMAGTYVFAFNLDMPDPEHDRVLRIATVRAALRHIGALPDR